MDNRSERGLAYSLATPIQESDFDQVSGGSGVGTGGKCPRIIVTGNIQSPDLVIEY